MLDLDARAPLRSMEYSESEIDWTGSTGGRGLRGAAFDGDTVYVATGAEILALTPKLSIVDTISSPYLLSLQGLCVYERMLYAVSATYDSVLGYDLDRKVFTWAINIARRGNRFGVSSFDPAGEQGPLPLNGLHLQSVYCDQGGMYLSGLKSGGLLHFNGKDIRMAVELPANARDARPFRNGVIFNDSDASALRYTGRGDGQEDRAFRTRRRDTASLSHVESIEDGIIQNGFARGLCVLSDRVVAAGSSPARINLYDLAENDVLGSVDMTVDARETLYTIASWPFDE